MKIKREVKIAAVFILSFALLIWGINFLKGNDIFKKTIYFYAVYEDVSGLETEDPVNINGLKVGQVEQISFHPNNSGDILVKFSLNNTNISVPDNSTAKIYSADLMNSKAIRLILGNSKSYMQNGDTLLAAVEASLQEQVSVQMMPVKKKAEDLMLSLDSVLAVVQYIFNDETRKNITKSFASIKNTIQNLESTTHQIDTLMITQKGKLRSIIVNVEAITKNIKENNDKFNTLLNNVAEISDTLRKAELSTTVAETNKSLKEFKTILRKVNNQEGTLGKLIHSDSLYDYLNKNTQELELLLEDIRLNPHRYLKFSVFGKNPKKMPYESPEDK